MEQGLIDGTWLIGLAGGQNQLSVNGLTAHSGGGQASALPIPPGIYMVEFDTVAAGGDSAGLPFAGSTGVEIAVINNTANSMNVFANPGTNPATGAADTLNGGAGTALAVTAHSVGFIACAKLGVWIGK
jgi:hypothetical protein